MRRPVGRLGPSRAWGAKPPYRHATRTDEGMTGKGCGVLSDAWDRLGRGERSPRTAIVWHDVGVAHDQANPLDPDAEFLRGSLGKQCPGALAHLDLAGESLENAVFTEPHRSEDRRVGPAY